MRHGPRTSSSSRTPRPPSGRASWPCSVGSSLYDVGAAVEDSLTASGARRGREYGIVEDYVGHGIGTSMHMDPQVPNYRVSGKGPRVVDGTTICIEPMVVLGDQDNTHPRRRLDRRDPRRLPRRPLGALRRRHGRGLTVLTAVDGGEQRLRALGATYVPIDPA